MRVLCTGARGFIGSYLTAELEGRGCEVVPYDLPADIRDPFAVSRAMTGCDHVIHLAGILGTAELFAEPHKAVDVNVHGTLNVLRACAEHGAGYTGITMPDSPWRNLYAATKGAAVHIAEAYHHTHGVPVSHVRAFNAYGRGQRHGHGHPRKIVPSFSVRAWKGEPIQVWGSGEQTVDLVHAADLAAMLADAMAFGKAQIFDGGTGQPLTVNEVAETVLEAAGGGRVEHLPMRAGETENTRIAARGDGWDLLGWQPRNDPAVLGDVIQSYAEVRG